MLNKDNYVQKYSKAGQIIIKIYVQTSKIKKKRNRLDSELN